MQRNIQTFAESLKLRPTAIIIDYYDWVVLRVGLTTHNVERKHHLFIDLLFSSRFQIPLVSTIPRSVSS